MFLTLSLEQYPHPQTPQHQPTPPPPPQPFPDMLRVRNGMIWICLNTTYASGQICLLAKARILSQSECICLFFWRGCLFGLVIRLFGFRSNCRNPHQRSRMQLRNQSGIVKAKHVIHEMTLPQCGASATGSGILLRFYFVDICWKTV